MSGQYFQKLVQFELQAIMVCTFSTLTNALEAPHLSPHMSTTKGGTNSEGKICTFLIVIQTHCCAPAVSMTQADFTITSPRSQPI